MNIGFISTRLAGTDGVSLETAKMADVLRRQGHNVFYCAGELEGDVPGLLAPELHFKDTVAEGLGRRAFESAQPDPHLRADIAARARFLQQPLRRFLVQYAIDTVIVQNAFAIPMQLPLAQALAYVLQETRVPALAHNHDLYWERERFRHNQLEDFLDTYFPPNLPRLQHATINSLARRALRRRRGLDSVVIPNVFDFDTSPPGIDDYNRDFRQALDLDDEHWLILQPTRVIPRKGIELALELVARLRDPRATLVITHPAGDEGLAYLHHLQQLADQKGLDLRYAAERIEDRRRHTPDLGKIYSLWDAYPHADLITYPSLVEGFGNALLETVYFRKPAMVNRYDVYLAEIAPLGFRFAEIDGAVSSEAVSTVRRWLEDPSTTREIVEHNFRLAAQHYSYETLAQLLLPLLS